MKHNILTHSLNTDTHTDTHAHMHRHMHTHPHTNICTPCVNPISSLRSAFSCSKPLSSSCPLTCNCCSTSSNYYSMMNVTQRVHLSEW